MHPRLASPLRTAGAVFLGFSLASLPDVPAAGAASLAPGLNFRGGTRSDDLSSIENGAPDSMGAVGPDEVVYLVNNRYAVFRKSDGAELASDTPRGFWSAAGVDLVDSFDPSVYYDPASGRFFAVAAQYEPVVANHLVIAVSKSSDPREGWSAFSIDPTPGLVNADFPRLGVDAEGVYVTNFTGNGTFSSYDVTVFPKADLLAATPTVANATVFANVSPGVVGFGPVPVTKLDGGGLPTKLLGAGASYFGVVQSATLSGPVTAPSLTKGPPIVLPGLPKAPDARQPGTAPNIYQENEAAFRSGVVQRDGAIWAVHTVGSPSGRDAIEWLQLDAATNIVLQSGLIEDPALDFIFPSLAVNEHGEVVIGFTATGEEMFPSAFAVLGETTAATTTFGTPVLLEQGTASYEVQDNFGRGTARFGDYSATVVDPIDSRTFWTFQEWVSAEDDWAVQVTQLFVVPEPGAVLLLAGALAGLAITGRMRA
jgi:hypothetical protein